MPESERTEGYKSGIELARGTLGVLNVGESPRRAVMLRRLEPKPPWTDGLLDQLAESAKRAEVIHHPSLLAVVDSVRSTAGLLVVTEYVQGVPLPVLMQRAREKKKPMPVEVAKRMALDLARAVQAAQELLAARAEHDGLSWLHPECVLVSSGDDALVADVGMLALANVPDHPEIAAYRAPELAKSGTEAAGTAAVYSLGILLWELLANRDALGQTGPGATSASVQQRAIAGAVPRLDLVRRDVPSLLVEIVMQSVHRDPSARFPDAGALGDALSTLEAAPSGVLVRYMTELCSDLVDRQKNELVMPHVAATSWRPTVHPHADALVPKIPRAPRAIGLAGFSPSATPIPPNVSEASEPEKRPSDRVSNVHERITLVDDKERVEIAGALEEQRLPLAIPPSVPEKKPAATRTTESLLTSTAALETEDFPLPRRRGGLIAVVLLVVAGAVAIGVLALQKRQQGPIAESAPAAAGSPASSVASNEPIPPPPSATTAPSASSSARAERNARPLSRREREERRSSKDKPAASASASAPEPEDKPIPGSDNPYVDPTESR